MKKELTKEFADRLQLMVDNVDSVGVLEEIQELHPADLSDVLESLSTIDSKFIFDLLDDEVSAEVLMEFDDDYRDKFIKLLSTGGDCRSGRSIRNR
jgi:magnesium transporter